MVNGTGNGIKGVRQTWKKERRPMQFHEYECRVKPREKYFSSLERGFAGADPSRSQANIVP